MKENDYKLTILNDIEFDNFAKNHECANFFQSIYMKKLLEKEGKEVYLLGLKNNGNILCATLLSKTSKFLSFDTYEALKGYLIDYNNISLIKIFTKEIIKFIKKKRGYRLIIDPYIPLIERDINGNIVPFKRDNTKVKKELLNIGFREIDNAQVKWTFVLDTNKDYDTLYKNMKANTRNIINKVNNKYKLIVEELSYDNLNIFKDITSKTCLRKHFKDRNLSYYQNIYKTFKDKVKVLISKLDIKLYLDELLKEKNSLINNLNSTNNISKKNNLNKDIEIINKKINELNNLLKNKHYLILSGAMFILYGNEIVYLFSGSNEEYMKYNGQYKLQEYIIKYACENNYKRYNFYGIDKNFMKDGVYEFKKGFNGYVEELIGAYEIKVNFIYTIHNLLKNIKKYYKK